jgi:hypothetical protein
MNKEITIIKNICEDEDIKWTYYSASKSFYIHAIIGNKTRLLLVKNLEELKRYI